MTDNRSVFISWSLFLGTVLAYAKAGATRAKNREDLINADVR
jgi:hypothetical protein